jgi:hypothetical protein
MRVTPIRETFSAFFKCLHWNRTAKNLNNAEMENPAETLVDYVRMRSEVNPQASAVVAVDELAFRFREDRRVIRNVLHILESRKRAKTTEFNDVWKLQI